MNRVTISGFVGADPECWNTNISGDRAVWAEKYLFKGAEK